MTLNDFYIIVGGSYDNIKSRLSDDQLIKKFIMKFKDENSFELLENSIINGDYKSAFNASHTLKGIALNLDFLDLYKNINELTELLRPQKFNIKNIESINQLFLLSKESYHKIISNTDKIN